MRDCFESAFPKRAPPPRHGFTSDAKEIGERLFGQAQFAAMQSPQAKRFQNLIG
jgi:hypothetical protein